MNKKTLIAYGSLIVIILILSLVIVFRKPVPPIVVEDTSRVYKDSIKLLTTKVEQRDLNILSKEKTIDSLKSLKNNNNIRYVQNVKFINLTSTTPSSLDSLIRKLSGLPQR